jgi:prepilin-type N-terminal cleavage/methylation domain-containing protein/prepilin-type processing-associated H-X9-DG protein
MTNKKYIGKKFWGFTLVELLVVIAIIAMLISIILSVLGRSRQAAYRLTCLNNLKQLGVAVMTYAQSYSFYPVCVPQDVNEKWSDFLADKSIAVGKELGVPVSLWPFHQTAALYNCPILSRMDCDISYCYNELAGRKSIDSTAFASVVPSYIPPTPAEEKVHYNLLSPEKVKSPVRFILLYDLPIKSNIIIGPDPDFLNDLYHDIDPDDYRKVETETFVPVTEPGPGYLWYRNTDGPHSTGHSILFADGHVKWYKKWSGDSMGRGPQ